MSMSRIYQTSDFPTALTLQVLRHELTDIDRTNPRRSVFYFIDSSELQEDLQKLRRGEIKVDPLDFWYAQKRLKQMLYDGQ